VARQGAKVVDEEQLSGKKAPAFRGTGEMTMGLGLADCFL
jgi:hypothetical protein